LARRVREMPLTGDAYGIIHGDLHNRNFHFSESNQPTLFDFDHGGYGWRAYDLCVSKLCLSDEAGEAFLESYQGVRPVSEPELAILPTFARIRPIWDSGDILAMQVAWGAEEEADEATCDRIVKMLDCLSQATWN
jgi:Ser/Thr protein kinase RdoA (MazF antagonist)